MAEDARVPGVLAPDTGTAATVGAICALARGLSEQAGTLPPKVYDATVSSAKTLIRERFSSVSPRRFAARRGHGRERVAQRPHGNSDQNKIFEQELAG